MHLIPFTLINLTYYGKDFWINKDWGFFSVGEELLLSQQEISVSVFNDPEYFCDCIAFVTGE